MMPPSYFRLTAIPLIATSVSLFFVGCSKENTQNTEALATLEAEVASLNKQKTTLQNQVKLSEEEFKKRFEEVLKQNEDSQKSQDQLKEALEKAQDEAEKIRQEFREYQQKYKLSMRQKAKGLSVPAFATADGKNYSNCQVVEVTADGIKLRHEAGAATVSFEKLTPEWQQKVAYDPQEEAKAREEAQAAAAALVELKPTSPVTSEQVKSSASINVRALNNYRNRIKSRESELNRLVQANTSMTTSTAGMSALNKLQAKVNQEKINRLKNEIIDIKNQMNRYIEVNIGRKANG